MHGHRVARILLANLHRAHPLERLLLICAFALISFLFFERVDEKGVQPRSWSAKPSAGSISGRNASFLIAFESGAGLRG
jgi:hypothetical protein